MNSHYEQQLRIWVKKHVSSLYDNVIVF